MALTTRSQRAGYPITLHVGRLVAGREAWVKLSQVRTPSVDRIGGYLDRLDETVLDELVDGLVQLIA